MKKFQNLINTIQIKKIYINKNDINAIINNKPIPINYYNNYLIKNNDLTINCCYKNCQRKGNYTTNNLSYCWIHCQKIEI